MKTMYLVTGAAGHLGLNLVQQLCAAGARVRALVLPGDPNAAHLPAGVEIVTGDVCNRDSLRPFFAPVPETEQIVIHAAGIVSIATDYDPLVWAVNVKGTGNVISLCQSAHVRRLVYVSSVHAMKELPKPLVMRETDCFDPDTVFGAYAKSKAAATRLVQKAAGAGLDACICLPSGMLGPMDYAHGHMTQLILSDQLGKLPVCVRGGYDFADARDVAGGIIACCTKGRSGACYLMNGRFLPVSLLLQILHKLQHRRVFQPAVPLGLAKAFSPIAEYRSRQRHEKPLFTEYSLRVLNSNALFSHKKAATELGYTVRPIEDTLRDTVDFLHYSGALPSSFVARPSVLFRSRGIRKA